MTYEITTAPNLPSRNIPAFGGWCPQVDAARSNATIWVRRINVPFACTVDAISFVSGADGTGNVVVGLYRPVSSDTATGSVLIASGVASQGGSYGVPAKTVSFSSSVNLTAGDYYITIQTQNSTQAIVANPQWSAPSGCSMEVSRAYDGTSPSVLGTASDSSTNMTLSLRVVQP